MEDSFVGLHWYLGQRDKGERDLRYFLVPGHAHCIFVFLSYTCKVSVQQVFRLLLNKTPNVTSRKKELMKVLVCTNVLSSTRLSIHAKAIA